MFTADRLIDGSTKISCYHPYQGPDPVMVNEDSELVTERLSSPRDLLSDLFHGVSDSLDYCTNNRQLNVEIIAASHGCGIDWWVLQWNLYMREQKV